MAICMPKPTTVIPNSTEKDQCGVENVEFCTLVACVQRLACRAISASAESLLSASLTINAIERKRSWNRSVAYPVCRSACVSVSPESVLWQNG